MTLEKPSPSPELEEFQHARRVLVQAIWREIDKDDAKQERTWYSTGVSMMRFQINFYLKCLYDDTHHLNNQRAYSEMKHKYRSMEPDAKDYIASLDAIDHGDLLSIIDWNETDASSRIIAAFEHDLLTHIDLKQATERRKHLVWEILSN